MGDIRIGTSGFSYEDWKGFFYSETTKKSDMLAYYARHFSTVEVNSTYYAIPSPITFERMLSKVPDDFEFAVKAHQDITHAPQLESSTVQTFNRAIRPLIDAGRHGCILAQFLWSFRCTSDGVARIRLLRDLMGDLPLIVEFRNSEWVSEKAFDFLRKHNLGFCCVDEPACKGLMHRISVVTSPIGYMRFHGRNASKWWKHNEAWERYDYRNTTEEMQKWIPGIRKMADETEKTFVFFNNHYQGKGADNAAQFAAMLGGTSEHE